MHDRPRPLGGPLLTKSTVTLGAIVIAGLVLIGWRFAVGLGASTGLNDGYPWGLWIAYDVVTGTALACGGYAVAILVYVLNRGRYHPLVRPAVLTSALGYTLAAVSVVVDLGRPWNMWKIPLPWKWNTNSVLLEVAMCIMLYFFVLWVELAPAFIERAEELDHSWTWLRAIAKAVHGPLDKALPFILALGLLLPTMHQSSLGSLLLVARTKLHPLWHTGFLPLLYLISVIGMGYAVVVFESSIQTLALHRETESKMLSKLAGVIPLLTGVWLLIRLVDIFVSGKSGYLFSSGMLSWFFWAEIALTVVASIILWPARSRTLPQSTLFRAAVLLLIAGCLYRFDTFLVAFNPGPQWHYFPSITEIFVTVGIIAIEVLGYILVVKLFPILTGRPRASRPTSSTSGTLARAA